MRSIHIEAPAEQDLEAAADFYESRRSGWGRHFMNRFKQGLKTIREMPAKYRIIYEPYHCYTMVQFPFGVIYRFDETTVTIVGVIDHRRSPEYWQTRLDSDSVNES